MTDIISWGLDFDLEYEEIAPYGVRANANYTIEVDDADSVGGLQVITSDARYPRRMSPLADEPTMLCINTKLKQNKQCPNNWMLHVEWDNVTPQPYPDFFDNPLLREAVIQAGTYETVKRLQTDINGKPVATTAGEIIFLEIPVDYRMFTITKNVKAIPDMFAEKGNFLNKDAVVIMGHTFTKNILHMKKVDMDGPRWENGFKFWIATFTILCDPDQLWQFERRNAGYQERGDPVTIKDANGNQTIINPLQSIRIGPPGKLQYPSSPVLLDPNGRAYRGTDINTGQTVVLTPESNSTGGITQQQWVDSLLKFTGYKSISFTDNIPLK